MALSEHGRPFLSAITSMWKNLRQSSSSTCPSLSSGRIPTLRSHSTAANCRRCILRVKAVELCFSTAELEILITQDVSPQFVLGNEASTQLDKFKVTFPEESCVVEENQWDRRLFEIFRMECKLNSQVTKSPLPISTEGSEEGVDTAHTIPRHLPGYTGSADTFTLARQWLHTCSSHHPACRPHIQADAVVKFPTRILDLSNDTIILREHLTTRNGTNAIYATLSHRWSNVTAQTTASTLDQHKTHIPHDVLPRTFLDAADACRRLGITFLWIDSLCIIQGDAEDWAREAAAMGSIYAHAHIVLAATHGGIYSVSRAPFKSRLLPDEDGATFVRGILPRFPDGYEADEADFPILTRGWVFQEMRLARRVLHFCRDEVVWRCRCATWSEDTAEPAEVASSDVVLASGGRGLGTFETPRTRNISPEIDPGLAWRCAIEEYSRLNLTRSTDRLPALAALARRMGNIRGPGDRYLAGLWKKTLLLDLAWHQVTPLGWVVQAAVDRQSTDLPTWSWAAAGLKTTWFNRSEALIGFVEVLDVECETVGPEYLGLVKKGANILLRGPCIDVRIDAKNLRSSTRPADMPQYLEEGKNIFLQRPDIDLRFFESNGKELPILGFSNRLFDGSAGWRDRIDITRKIIFLPLSVECKEDERKEIVILRGLVLQQTSTEKVYERLGLQHYWLQERGRYEKSKQLERIVDVKNELINQLRCISLQSLTLI